MSNNGPDIELPLTHEQATFLLKNMIANTRLCLKLIISIADEDIELEEKQIKAQKIVNIQEKYRDIMQLLHKAGAKQPDDE